MAETKKPGPPKVFDVSKPGKSAPSATSKPIIVTNRAVLRDPMMTEEKEELPVDMPPQKDKPAGSTISRIRIEPIHHDELPDKIATKSKAKEAKAAKVPEPAPEAEPEDETPSAPELKDPEPTIAELAAPDVDIAADLPKKSDPEPEPESTADKSEPEPETEEDKPEPEPEKKPEPAEEPEESADDDEAEADDKTDDDPDADTSTHDKPKDGTKEAADEIAARKEAERAEELQKLVDNKKFYLPINQVERRRNKRQAIIGLVVVVLLALAWADIALDAGIVQIPGVKPPTHFFKK